MSCPSPLNLPVYIRLYSLAWSPQKGPHDIIIFMLCTLGTINDRDLQKQVEDDDELTPRQTHDEAEIRGFQAIVLSPGKLVSPSRFLLKPNCEESK